MAITEKDLLITCFAQEPVLARFSPDDLLKIAEKLSGQAVALSDLYVDIYEGQDPAPSPLECRLKNSEYTLLKSGLSFQKEEILCYLAILIDVMDDILPLGSVVDLKKEHLKKMKNIEKIENVRIVITHRFLLHSKNRFYFPYAGVIYPLGSMGEERTLHFTSSFIERVVHRGYSDEQEKAFVLMMKQDLLCRQKMQSFGFAPKDTINK
jgi:hypothetical protein